MQFTFDQISKIIEISQNEIEDNENYQLLLKGSLYPFWNERVNKQTCFCLYISDNDLQNMDFPKVSQNLTAVNVAVLSNNTIRIGSEGQILEKQYQENATTKDAKSFLSELSKDYYVFFFGEDGITSYANGRVLEDNNIFYSRSDRMKYLQKKDISRIEEVICEYRDSYLTQQVNYMAFLADNSTIRQVNGGQANIAQNILKNKPEHYMRDQLRQYLTDHMQYTFTIEPELGQSKRELDIYFDVKGELYFIEIKWLGKSINDAGNGFSQSYGPARAKDGVIQSLEYIEELTNTSETCLRCGYLAVYDCRDRKTAIDTTDFSFVKPELQKYVQLFSFLPIITVQKTHPA